MPGTCILTDNTVQFPIPAFTGRNLVYVLPLGVEINGKIYDETIKAADLPISTRLGKKPRAVPPSPAQFQQMFNSLGSIYDEVVVIVHSVQLGPTYEIAKQAAKAAQGLIKITVIDSQTTATGMGLVVQAACAAAEDGMNGAQIEDLVRSLLPRVYTLFFSEGMTYFINEGFLGEAQALIAEYLRMLPMFILDAGNLIPAQKARNYRHMVDLLHEFICEFPELEHIALIQGVPPFENETRALRERLDFDYPDTPISEHTISAPLAAMIGPRSLGLFLLQKDEQW
jgi:DegV family protein with EDD domain